MVQFMLKGFGIRAVAGTALALSLVACGGGEQESVDAEKSADTESAEIVEKAAVTPTLACVGDNDQAGQSCFNGVTLNSAYSYLWQYVTGAGFYNNNARVTKYSSGSSDAATWKFTTLVGGDIWFSVFVPSTNATTKQAWYTFKCESFSGGVSYYNSLGKNINQLNYSQQWVTLGNLGTFPAFSKCEVSVRKLDGSTTSKMAVDGMKMTIY